MHDRGDLANMIGASRDGTIRDAAVASKPAGAGAVGLVGVGAGAA